MKLSGKIVSDVHLNALTNIIERRTSVGGWRIPRLAFFLVGNRADSRIYVDIKKKMCDRVGIGYKEFLLPDETSSSILAENIELCNCDDTIDGIIIQLPLPDHLPEESLLQMVYPDKDVDGFHALNIARLVSRPVMDSEEIEEMVSDNSDFGLGSIEGRDNNCDPDQIVSRVQKSIINTSKKQCGFTPCTPQGIVTLLDFYGFKGMGKRALIIGCGRVGRPLGLMLLARGMTVSYIDRHTRHIDTIKRIRDTDLLVVAVGIRGVIDTGLISSHTVVVDVGIHQTATGKTVGDLVLKNLLDNEKHGRVEGIDRTPVPGGVGPMTVAMLLENTVISWVRRLDATTTRASYDDDQQKIVCNSAEEFAPPTLI